MNGSCRINPEKRKPKDAKLEKENDASGGRGHDQKQSNNTKSR